MKLPLLLLACLTPVCFSDNHLAEKYPFSTTLHEGYYYLYWNFSSTDETIQFAVRVKTTGWVGFGISPNGQMPGSDVVIGWVDGQKSYFHDRYAFGHYLPPIDKTQNWFLMSAMQDGGYTELEFSRSFTTCDHENRDLDILADTSRIIYSWNDNLPNVTQHPNGSEMYSFNLHQSYGLAGVNLLGGLPNPPHIPSGAKTFNVQVENVQVPNKDTTYWCRAVNLKEIVDSYDNEKYIVKFSPLITASNKAYVHHMLVYMCDGLQESDLGPGGECSDINNGCFTEFLIAAWTIGGSDFVYPDNVAYPIGGSTGKQFAMIEIHYNNPKETAGIVDSSGIQFTYLETPREHNAGILFIGHEVSSFMVVPPNAANYTVSAFCPMECTNEYFPPEGIKIFANTLHTHYAGTGLTFSVIRKNEISQYEELKPIEKNLKYDFNFQQATHLAEEITVFPGDILLLRCYYNTQDRKGVTLGGLSTQQEMCLAFPVYYPKVEMNGCTSKPTFNKIESFIGSDVPSEDQNSFPVSFNNTSPPKTTTFNTLEWTNRQINSFEKNTYQSGTQYAYCYSIDDFDYVVEPLPDFKDYHAPPKPAAMHNCTVPKEAPDGTDGIHEIDITDEINELGGAKMIHMSTGLLVLFLMSALLFL